MNDSGFIPFDDLETRYAPSNDEGFIPFDQIELPQDQDNSPGRYAAQIPAAAATIASGPLDIFEQAVRNSILTKPTMRPYREGKTPEQLQNITQNLPTYHNYEQAIEEKTGVPLQAKNTAQELTRLGAMAAMGRPGSAIERGIAGVAAPAVSGGLRALGAPKEIADLAGLAGPQLFQATKNFVANSLPGAKAQRLAESLGGGEPPGGGATPFETAEKALQALEKDVPKAFTQEPPRIQAPTTQPVSKKSTGALTGRAAAGGRDVGFRPTTVAARDVSEDVGRIISPQRFYNTTQGGRAIKNEIMRLDDQVYQNVNDLYTQSRALNENVTGERPSLVNRLENHLAQLEQIPSPSGPQQQLMRAQRDIINRLTVLDEEGNFLGYAPISNQVLIDQIQSLRQKIDYEFAHGDSHNIFRRTIGDIQDSLEVAGVEAPQAYAANQAARQAYANWAQTFDNPYVRPLRDISNRDFSKITKGSLDLDEFNQLSPILSADARGTAVNQMLKRSLVDKHLAAFYEEPAKATGKKFDVAMRELEAVLTPEEATAIRNEFRDINTKASRKVVRVEKPTPEEVKVGKYFGKEPEDILRRMNSRSGIRELRKDLEAAGKDKEWQDLRKSKIRSELREGDIGKKFTGKQLRDVLGNEKKRDLFYELMGKEVTDAAYNEALRLGNIEMTADKIKSAGKNIAAVKFLLEIQKLLG